MATISSLHFDSRAMDRPFDEYRKLYSSGADVTEIGPRFEAVMSATPLDRAIIFDRHLSGVGHARDTTRARRDGFDHLTATLVLSGSFMADAGNGDGYRRVAPGETVLFDMTRTMASRSHDAHVVTLSIARDRVTAVLGGRTDDLNGRIINAQDGVLLADHMRSVARHAPDIRDTMLIPLSRIAADMLATALGDHVDEEERWDGHARMLRLDQIKAFIERNLADPDLDATAIAARFGISRATLYRTLQPHGGPSRYIRRRRLHLLRMRLTERGRQASLADSAADAGFSSDALASEAFVAEYGVRPGLYRNQLAQETECDLTRRKLKEWTSDLLGH